MHWEILIIPLIALGVWILGTLFKGPEEDPRKKGARRSGSAPGRRPVTDLDRFLEEARRRREVEERQKVPAPPPPPRPAVSRPPLSERPSRPRPVPQPPPPPRRAERVPTAVPVAAPTVPEAVLVEPAPAAEAPSPPPALRQPTPSPVVQQARSLLSRPQSAGAAFVLREIFDPPLCMRRRH